MHDRKDSYGNTWYDQPSAAAAVGGTPGPEPAGELGELGEPDAEGAAGEVSAGEVQAGQLDAGGRWVPDHSAARDAAMQATERHDPRAAQRWEWAWLGLDSRDGRMLAGDTGPLTSGAIKFGEVREVWVRPMRPFRGRYLWVHSAVAKSFLIHSVRVGHCMPGVATQPIAADFFAVDYADIAKLTMHEVEPGRVIRVEVHQAPGSMPRGPVGWRGIPFDLPTARVGMDVGIIVENIARGEYEPIRFLGGFLGHAPRSEYLG